MERIFIVGSFAELDGVMRYRAGLFSEEAAKRGLSMKTLTISPLSEDWHAPLPVGHFRCGNAPIMALERALRLLSEGSVELVTIRGEDRLRTGYRRDDRMRLMQIYPTLPSITHGYDKLSRLYAKRRGIDLERFLHLRDLLFENYLTTYLEEAPKGEVRKVPGEQLYNPVTELFRRVDCANPVVDFRGEVVLAAEGTIDKLVRLPDGQTAQPVELAGVGTGETSSSGVEALGEISGYAHLRKAIEMSEKMAGIRVAAAFNSGEALLEVYTCFPVVPLAFLLESSICEVDGLEEAIESRPLTVTGGMNLARAPWNNPVLRALAAMHEKLLESATPLGIVHGNGGLGHKQGVAILKSV